MRLNYNLRFDLKTLEAYQPDAVEHIPAVDAYGQMNLTAEEIVALHEYFDVKLTSRGGKFAYNIQGERTHLSKPEPVVLHLSLDIKGSGFRRKPLTSLSED